MWSVIDTEYAPARGHHAETIFTIGNGYLCTRGSLEEAGVDQWRTTFAHGVFDPVPLFVTEQVNLPDWTALIIVSGGETFEMTSGEVLQFRRELDLRSGTLHRRVVWRSPSGRISTLEFSRFASLADEHLVALRVRVTPQDEVPVRITSTLGFYAPSKGDGTHLVQHTKLVANLSGRSDAALDMTRDDMTRNMGTEPNLIGLHVRTMAGRYDIAVALRHDVAGQLVQSNLWDLPGNPALVYDFLAGPDTPAQLSKVGGYQTSRDGSADVAEVALRRALDADSYDRVWLANSDAWHRRWQTCDIEIDGDEAAQLAVRFNMYHLIIAAPTNDERVNIGAKTLSGFGYRAHAFWDTEIFILPYFIHTQPRIAKNLLNYRWHNLAAAHQKALENGCQGAQFPWESADTGQEVCPTWVVGADGALVRIWTGDIEIHINADIAYGAYQYWKVTGDDDWYYGPGADLIQQTAIYWASRLTLEDDGRYHLRDVIGPDEYHEHVDDNAYTNAFAQWHLKLAHAQFCQMRALRPHRAAEITAQLGITDKVTANWLDMADRIALTVASDGLIEQFQGYFGLADVDLAAMEPRTVSVQAALGIHETNQTQILKQPDVLMLLFLLREEFDARALNRNYDYYNHRTDHRYGSSLGPAMSAIIASEVGRTQEAYEHFMLAALADLEDPRGNAEDGIHAASCGGTWQAVVLGFAGLRATSQGWSINPKLPAHWTRLAFRFMHAGEVVRVEIPNRGAAGYMSDNCSVGLREDSAALA